MRFYTEWGKSLHSKNHSIS